MPGTRTRKTMTSIGIALACAVWHVCAIAGAEAHGTAEDTGSATNAPNEAAETWRPAARFRGDWKNAISVALVDDPNTIITADGVGSVTVWDIKASAPRFSTPPHPGARPAVVADAAGKRIVVGVASADAMFAVWNASTGARMHEFRGSFPDISRDGSVVAAVSAWDAVTLWDVESGGVIATIASGKAAARAVSLNAKGGRVAIGWGNRRAEVWSVRSASRLMEAVGHTRSVTAVDLTPDGSRLVTASGDKSVKVWDVATGTLLGTCGSNYGNGLTGVTFKSGTRVLVATRSGFADLWNVQTGKRVRRYGTVDAPAGRAVLSPDGRRLAGLYPGYGVAVWRTGTGERVAVSTRLPRFRAVGVQLNSDGSQALAFAKDGYATLHDTSTGKELRSFGEAPTEKIRMTTGGALLAVRLIGDGRHYLDASDSESMALRDVTTGDVVRSFGDGPAVYQPFILSPDHGLLLTGGLGGYAHIWDVATGAHVRELAVDRERVMSASFDAANTTLVTTAQYGPVRVWDAQTGEARGIVPSEANAAFTVSVSPSGQYLLMSRSRPHEAPGVEPPTASHLWDLRTRTKVAPSTEWISGSAWQSDSRVLYTLGHDGHRSVVRSWSPDGLGRLPGLPARDAWARTAAYRSQPLRTPSQVGHRPVTLVSSYAGGAVPSAWQQAVSGLALSADGGTLAHVGADGAIDIWAASRRPGRRSRVRGAGRQRRVQSDGGASA